MVINEVSQAAHDTHTHTQTFVFYTFTQDVCRVFFTKSSVEFFYFRDVKYIIFIMSRWVILLN